MVDQSGPGGRDDGARHLSSATPGGLHHVELWVPDLPVAIVEWGWLLGELGYALHQQWPAGGPDHYAAYLHNTHGFEVELVSTASPKEL